MAVMLEWYLRTEKGERAHSFDVGQLNLRCWVMRRTDDGLLMICLSERTS